MTKCGFFAKIRVEVVKNQNKMTKFRFILALFVLVFVPNLASAEQGMAQRLSGRVLLEVERHGEAWYVSPSDGRRYFLGGPEDAHALLSEQGLGITDADLARIPLPDESGDETTAQRLAGRILLQVESRGEAWYVDPSDLKRYRLSTPTETFRVLQHRGLGISNANIALVPRWHEIPESVFLDVPFVAQAPFAEWNDRRQHEACEEAAVYMALKWVNNETGDLTEARNEFIAASDWQRDQFGYYHDTSAEDTLQRLIKTYYNYEDADLHYDITVQDIKTVLRDRKIVLVPVNGRALGNPFFSPPGPLRHMVVVVGYDADTDEYITHDPGTRRGANMRYTAARLQNSLGDYISGAYVPLPSLRRTAMIVVGR